jgi:hypothetical protein
MTRDTEVQVDQWQLEKLALCGLKHPVIFYTPKVDRNLLGALGDSTYSNLEEAVAAMLKGQPADATVALVPEGPYTFARAR